MSCPRAVSGIAIEAAAGAPCVTDEAKVLMMVLSKPESEPPELPKYIPSHDTHHWCGEKKKKRFTSD